MPPVERPPSPGRWRLLGVIVAAAALAVFAVPKVLRAHRDGAPAPPPPPAAPDTAAASASAAPRERADKDLDRSGHTQIGGGILMVLPEFSSADGKFDLVLHVHGGSEIVQQGFAVAKVDAVLAVFNLGIGSGVYDEFFGYKPRFNDVLEQATEAMKKRGLANASIRRIALCAFSAGFGGVEKMLLQPGASDRVDAVILLDAMHASFDEKKQIDLRKIEPFIGFAERAVRGEKLFYISHSDIGTYEYASTHATADALLEKLGLARTPGGEAPPMPDLPAYQAPGAKKDLHLLQPTSHVEKGSFYLRGFAGERPENHMPHLYQMASTALPLLVARWKKVETR